MYRPGTSISKAKVKNSGSQEGQYNKVQQQKMPTLQDYIKKRDWIGAVALLESERNVNIQVENSLWLAYCYFHMGEYRYLSPQLENQSTSMMNSSGRPKIRTTISTRPAATTHYASMMTPGGKPSKAQKHPYRLDFSSTLLIRKMMRKT